MTQAPETIRQAQRTDGWMARYRRILGCDLCAAAAGWGHALGRNAVRPPCPRCRRLVDTWPGPEVNGWRRLPDNATSADLSTASAWPVDLAPEMPRRSLTSKSQAA